MVVPGEVWPGTTITVIHLSKGPEPEYGGSLILRVRLFALHGTTQPE
jgi:hypothetical protein